MSQANKCSQNISTVATTSQKGSRVHSFRFHAHRCLAASWPQLYSLNLQVKMASGHRRLSLRSWDSTSTTAEEWTQAKPCRRTAAEGNRKSNPILETGKWTGEQRVAHDPLWKRRISQNEVSKHTHTPWPGKKSPDEVGGIGAAANSTYCSSRGVKLLGGSQTTATSAPEDLLLLWPNTLTCTCLTPTHNYKQN